MKTIISIAIIIFSFGLCQAQIILAKQFEQNEYMCSGTHFENVNLYATYNSSSEEIKIYDINHNVVKSVIYPTEESFYRIFIYGLSKDVFNSNDNIEFIVQSFNGKGESKFELIDDQNNIIQKFQNAGIRTIGNKNYIVESIFQQLPTKGTQTDKLYAINGKFRKIIY